MLLLLLLQQQLLVLGAFEYGLKGCGAALEGALGEDSPADDGLLDAFESPRTLQRKPAASSVLCFQERFAKTL